VFWIALADDASHALPLDDLAVLADRLHAATNFHVQLPPLMGIEGVNPLKISEVSL
jgi:hypothetical protein